MCLRWKAIRNYPHEFLNDFLTTVNVPRKLFPVFVQILQFDKVCKNGAVVFDCSYFELIISHNFWHMPHLKNCLSVLQPVWDLSKIKLYWSLGIGFNFVAFSWSKRSGLAWTVRIHDWWYHFMLYNWWKWHWSVPKIVQSN